MPDTWYTGSQAPGPSEGDPTVKSKLIVIGLMFAGILAAEDVALAQLFGERQFGNALSRERSQPRSRTMTPAEKFQLGTTSGGSGSGGSGSGGSGSQRGAAQGENLVGSVTGTERFYRGNREAGDFVGADLGDTGTFVGAQQVKELTPQEIQSAVSDLSIPTGPDANRVQPQQSRARMYEPRLRVNFPFSPPAPRKVSSTLVRRLESALSMTQLGRIEVSLEDGTATLRGEVASERERNLARLLILFEPGISDVRNELTVTAPQTVPSNQSQPNPPQPSSSEIR